MALPDGDNLVEGHQHTRNTISSAVVCWWKHFCIPLLPISSWVRVCTGKLLIFAPKDNKCSFLIENTRFSKKCSIFYSTSLWCVGLLSRVASLRRNERNLKWRRLNRLLLAISQVSPRRGRSCHGDDEAGYDAVLWRYDEQRAPELLLQDPFYTALVEQPTPTVHVVTPARMYCKSCWMVINTSLGEFLLKQDMQHYMLGQSLLKTNLVPWLKTSPAMAFLHDLWQFYAWRK